MKSTITLNGIGRIFSSLLTRYWFSICFCAALIFLETQWRWEVRLTNDFPLEPQSQTGAIYSWSSHIDHKQHYLTAEAHRNMSRITAALLIYWFTICLASWVRIGMPSPSTWRDNYFAPDPEQTPLTLCIVIFGGAISLFLLVSAGVFAS